MDKEKKKIFMGKPISNSMNSTVLNGITSSNITMMPKVKDSA